MVTAAKHTAINKVPAPIYPPALPQLSLETQKHITETHARTSTAFVDGWCMWPNVWDGDMIFCETIAPLILKKGMITDSSTLDAWKRLDGKVVFMKYGGKPMIKRVQFSTPEVIFVPDNTLFHPAFIAIEDTVVDAVVTCVVPVNRDFTRLPWMYLQEYHRLEALKGEALLVAPIYNEVRQALNVFDAHKDEYDLEHQRCADGYGSYGFMVANRLRSFLKLESIRLSPGGLSSRGVVSTETPEETLKFTARNLEILKEIIPAKCFGASRSGRKGTSNRSKRGSEPGKRPKAVSLVL